jgi:hypothetical protein
MSESLTAFCVPDKWQLKSSVSDTILLKIVGLIALNGEELWLPDSPKAYRHKGGYSDGYSTTDIQETLLPFQGDYADKLANFFRVPLLQKRWYDIGLNREVYDCHWFGGWMRGLINLDHSTRNSLAVAAATIKEGAISTNVPEGAIGIIGGKTGDEVDPDHTYMGLDEQYGLQVMGIHGAVTIAPQAATIQHFRENSFLYPYVNQENYGLYVRSS